MSYGVYIILEDDFENETVPDAPEFLGNALNIWDDDSAMVCIKECKCNLTQGLLEKSKLAQHAYEEGHKICWNKARVMQIERNTTYRKYKESAHKSLLDHPVS
jgi:hypothetical protein